jgi:hypothetical protein
MDEATLYQELSENIDRLNKIRLLRDVGKHLDFKKAHIVIECDFEYKEPGLLGGDKRIWLHWYDDATLEVLGFLETISKTKILAIKSKLNIEESTNEND